MDLSPEREGKFPFLRSAGYRKTSEEDDSYNCFAWAVDNSTEWWEPEGIWPNDVPNALEIDSFIALYATYGYQPCISTELESGFNKIAIFMNSSGTPSHAARQQEDGTWASKLGDWEDIEHVTLEALEGDFYGQVHAILRKPSQNS